MVDILPTVSISCDCRVRRDCRGSTSSRYLRNEPGAQAQDVVFSEYLENEEAMVRSAHYKLIVGRADVCVRMATSQRYPVPLPGPYERLYDLDHDPGETTDLAADPRLASVKDELINQMYARLESTWDGLEPIPRVTHAWTRSVGAWSRATVEIVSWNSSNAAVSNCRWGSVPRWGIARSADGAASYSIQVLVRPNS